LRYENDDLIVVTGIHTW